MPKLEFEPIQHPGLILNREELVAIQSKIDTHDWAKKAFHKLIENADKFVSTNIVIPNQKGQWSHYYACDDDGSRLETLSDTEHKCPTCDKIYTGEVYDRVVVTWKHNQLGNAARDLGLAYQLTGNEKYLAPAKKILLGYADIYLSFPLVDRLGKPDTGLAARAFATNLAEACWLVDICWAYDLIAEKLTEEERQHICNDMLNPGGREVIRRDLKIHNIRCWMNAAAGLAAICSHDEELAHNAIRGELGLENQIAKGILDDGFWYESSWGYHFYTMQALWPLTEAVRHIGINVYNERYKSFYDAPLNFAFPGLYLPALNDSGGGRTINNAHTYELAYARWGDPRYAGLIKDHDRSDIFALCFGQDLSQTAPPETNQSIDFSTSGVAILRDGTYEDPTVVSLDYGPHGGGHGHPEKLNIILYGAGHELAPDPGSIQYGVPLHLEWFKTTLSHNTVLVDQKPQEQCTGELHTFDIQDDIRIASATANDAYPGTQFKRTIALLNNNIVLDLVDLKSDSEHTYDWVFHCKGAFSSPLPFTALTQALGSEHGYQHVADPRATQTNETWQTQWSLDDAHVTLVQVASPNTKVITGIGAGNPPSTKLPLVISRRQAKTTTYASAFVIRRNNKPEVDLSVDLTDTTATYHLTIDGEQQSIDLSR